MSIAHGINDTVQSQRELLSPNNQLGHSVDYYIDDTDESSHDSGNHSLHAQNTLEVNHITNNIRFREEHLFHKPQYG